MRYTLIRRVFVCPGKQLLDRSRSYDPIRSRGVRMPEWSGGALVTFVSNQTPAPVILSFDDRGRQLSPLILTIPESETIDLIDAARGSDGMVVACGKVYDHSGRGTGFLAVFGTTGVELTVIRLYPYSPSRIAVAADGSIWTAGPEDANPLGRHGLYTTRERRRPPL